MCGMKKAPEKVYKYRALSGDSFKYTMDILLNNRIYMPSRKSLNDPFEGVQNIYLGMSGNPGKQDIAELWEKMLEKYGVYSLSRCPAIPQMWAHYADGFKGVCLEFSTSNTFSKVREVLYTKDIIENADLKGLGKDGAVPFPTMLEAIMLRKSDGWAYEQEWRLLDDRRLNNPNVDTRYIYLLENEITAVILGSAIAEADEQFVREMIKPKPHIKLQRCRIVENRYEVEIVDI